MDGHTSGFGRWLGRIGAWRPAVRPSISRQNTVTRDPSTPHGSNRRSRGGDFRPDIEGLRAVAILAVVAFHAGLSAIPGGYVGVDVFFVISGFLITEHLGRELAESGRISFGTFYARRARRLLPSALLVIGVTVVVSCAVLPPLQAMVVGKDGLANAFYVGNYRYALQATNYLSASGPVSPLLNYWSLGVEEQFYLVWPALLLVASLVWWRRPTRMDRAPERKAQPSFSAILVAMALLAACSLAFSIWLTRANEPWAFFSLPARAWELAVGGLLALVAPRLRQLSFGAMALLSWLGIGAIVFSAVVFTSATPFPGTAALVPVAGAAAVVAGGCARARLGAVWLLGRWPMQIIGRVSYTWYLWHWPALVLAPSVIGHQLSVWGNVAVCALAFVLACLTTVLLERPLQRAPWLARPRRSLLLTVALSGAAVAIILLSTAALPSLTGSGHASAAKLSTPHLATTKSGTESPIDPVATAAQILTNQVQADVAQSVGTQDVPANLTPSLADAASDEATPFVDGCFDGFTDNSVNSCNYGDVTAPPSKTVVLFGDSHALMWFPAFDNLANQDGWHLIPQAKATCPPININVYSPSLGGWYTGCNEWRAAVVARIQALHPALVVLGFSREYGIPDDRVVVDGAAWMQGLSSMMTTLRATGAQVVLMGDVPYPQNGLVPDCLSAHLTDAVACTLPKQYPYYNPSGVGQEEAVAAAAGAGYITTQPWFCFDLSCAVIVNNILVYRDDNHITDTYASWLTPVLGADLEEATDGLFGTPP
jgi:peptidoglycan/LPS O-acetylase OafA/YrhL